MKSTPRSQIPMDIIPDILMEAVAEIKPDYDIMDAVKRLPKDLSAIVSMHFISGLSLRSVAEIMHSSEATIKRKKAEAIAHLRGYF